MSKEERYAEHTVAWELPNGDSVTKSNYNLADIETKYMPIQTEVICDDKDKTIADLEAKLAESEKDRDVWKSMAKCGDKLTEKMRDEYQQLKQQLAEKDKELKAKETLNQIFKDNRETKISFAVERLEKVKELLNTNFESTTGWIDPYENNEYLNSMTYNHNNTIEIIDNQIKQLKEGK